MQWNTRKHEEVTFQEIQEGDWIQRKTPNAKRFSNARKVIAVEGRELLGDDWTHVRYQVGGVSAGWIARYETENRFRRIVEE